MAFAAKPLCDLFPMVETSREGEGALVDGNRFQQNRTLVHTSDPPDVAIRSRMRSSFLGHLPDDDVHHRDEPLFVVVAAAAGVVMLEHSDTVICRKCQQSKLNLNWRETI